MGSQPPSMLNAPVDVSEDFDSCENVFFLADRLTSFDPDSGCGTIMWQRHARKPRMAFNQYSLPFEESESWEFPPDYPSDYLLPFSVSFVNPRTVRLRYQTGAEPNEAIERIMLDGPVPEDDSWEHETTRGTTTYRSDAAGLAVSSDPFHIRVMDGGGEVLTQTQHHGDTKSLQNCHPIPFSFVRRVEDMRRFPAATFTLSPDEGIYGCGESFTRLNKRGQKLVLWTQDAHGAQTDAFYKPIPFFMSSRGYGMFVHTSAPLTFDFGHSYDGAMSIFSGDPSIDIFLFVGEPKEILEEYTALTGRSPTPPLWSFGLWMSRITYKSEDETRKVAARLREEKIPCDVVHLDTGWFEQDWRCDYRFSEERFDDPARMIADLGEDGFHISLWQLPYLTPNNRLFQKGLDSGYVVHDAEGNLPTEDAIIDFSDPGAVDWYKGLLRRLLEMGIGAIKADFGEAAPLAGTYASGRSGWHEHNLYPLRYNRVVAEVTREVSGESIIWARSAWAGSQRYPVHWGGDAENTDCGMAASLRAGLSLGLSGFPFWSHDIGGFVQESPEELYRRWMPFGILTSHSRCHGAPPKEPWNYGEEFTGDFRRATELKYRLMPYIYTQARHCSETGLPMMRALFVEYPEDPTCWLIEDEYLFGRDLLVAPMTEESDRRNVYLPPGHWTDYQEGKVYSGPGWHEVAHGDIPVVLLVRNGAALPHVNLAQCTQDIDWSQIELRVFAPHTDVAETMISLPDDGVLQELRLSRDDGEFVIEDDPLEGRVDWTITGGGIGR